MTKKKQKPKSSRNKVGVVKTSKLWNSLPGFEFYVDLPHLEEHKFWVNAKEAKALDSLRSEGNGYLLDVVETAENKKKRVVTMALSAWLDKYARPV